MPTNSLFTIGTYLAKRLEQLNITDYFVVPGDYNLLLLDEILKNKNLNMISCCNELNAAYAADGYARARGIAVVFVTFSVGGLSALNAIAGAYAENLPVIIVSGGPNTNSIHNHQLLHHSLATLNFSYVREIFQKVTVSSQRIDYASDAANQIDHLITEALTHHKPVYLEIPCNLANEPIPSIPQFSLEAKKFLSNDAALQAAVNAAKKLLNDAEKPALVIGSLLKAWHAVASTQEFVEYAKYPVAIMPDAKSLFPEFHPQFVGIYWGPISHPKICQQIIETADAYLFAGAVFTDYSTCGFQMNIDSKKLILLKENQVHIGGQIFLEINIHEFLIALAKVIIPNNKGLAFFKPEKKLPAISSSNQSLTRFETFAHIQEILTEKNAVIAETGDSWFNCIDLKLPNGSLFEIQMTYGSIGWSVGCLLGYQLALKDSHRVIACIGDGSFQLTAQEVSTMIRYNLKPIIFVMNNHGYTIEAEIHDGIYNKIHNWNYSELISVFNTKNTAAWGCSVNTSIALKKALEKALEIDALCIIEVHLEKNDCNPNLLEWGKYVASSNSKGYVKPTGYNEF